MKKIKVQVVESIAEGIEELQMNVRERAYNKFLGREDGSNRELEDWFAAERELLCILTPTVTEQDEQIVAQVEMPEIKPENIQISGHHSGRLNPCLNRCAPSVWRNSFSDCN